MKISLDNLKNEINTRIAVGGLSELSECQLQGASNVVTGDALVPRVATLNDLPSAASSKGSMIYVDSINEYRFSNGLEWTDDVTSDFELIRGQVWSWGIGGRIGDGCISSRCSPVQEYYSANDWCQVSSQNDHSSALKFNGTLWSWGLNFFGHLGDGTTTCRCSPVQEFCSATNWCQVSAGSRHTAAIKTDGTIWSWGFGFCGILGDGSVSCQSSPVQEISSSTNWCQVSAGYSHSSAVKTDGTLWSWGYNCCGSLGDFSVSSKCSPVREISSSTNWCRVSSHSNKGRSLAIKTDGTLWSWGYNIFGELGDGTTSSKSSPVREISSSTNWCRVTAGNQHSHAIKSDGTLWGWGRGSFCGALGEGVSIDRCSPVQEASSSTNWCQVSAGTTNTGAVKTDGTLWGWGSNNSGTLGDGTVTVRSSPVQEISSSTNWCQVSTGNGIMSAIKIDFSKGF